MKAWWKKERDVPKGYDVNRNKDLARRNMYSDMSDEEYNAMAKKYGWKD